MRQLILRMCQRILRPEDGEDVMYLVGAGNLVSNLDGIEGTALMVKPLGMQYWHVVISLRHPGAVDQERSPY